MSLKSRVKKIEKLLLVPFQNEEKEKGMTLIEIILVISLLAIIMGILITNLTGQQENALKDAAKLKMTTLSQKLQQYRIDNYRYPNTEQGLNALLSNPGTKRWRGPYSEKDKLLDPWDTEFGYESDGRDFKIISAGPDGVLGNEDDISYPESESEEGS